MTMILGWSTDRVMVAGNGSCSPNSIRANKTARLISMMELESTRTTEDVILHNRMPLVFVHTTD